MANNTKKTSARVASTAGKTLSSNGASSIQKSLAGSALRQAGATAQTGSGIEAKASRALDNPRSSVVTKTLAGTVVSQSNKKR
jgi:type IV secretory pathway TrbL component